MLDTNTLAEPGAARPSSPVLEKVKTYSTSLAIASVTWQEMLYGMYLLAPGRRRDRIEDYLFRRIHSAFPILDFDENAARWQAEQRARLRKIGKSPSYPDSQIASIAATNDCVLVTRNISDFTEFDGLRTQNWFEPTQF